MFAVGMLSLLAMFGMMHIYVLYALVVMIIAKFIRRTGDYKSFKANMLAFTVFNTWTWGFLMKMLLVRKYYIELNMMMVKNILKKRVFFNARSFN